MKKTFLSITVILSLFLFSCQKEDSILEEKPETELKGDWKFMQFTMDGVTSTESVDENLGDMKIEIVMNYLSKNNKGTISFSNGKMSSNQLSYDVTGLVTLKTYFDGDVNVSSDSLNVFMPPSNGIGDYIQVTADSLYCPNGALIQMEGAEDMHSKPAGIKLKYEGNNLTMTVTQKESFTVTENGITQDKKSDLKMIVTLQKN